MSNKSMTASSVVPPGDMTFSSDVLTILSSSPPPFSAVELAAADESMVNGLAGWLAAGATTIYDQWVPN